MSEGSSSPETAQVQVERMSPQERRDRVVDYFRGQADSLRERIERVEEAYGWQGRRRRQIAIRLDDYQHIDELREEEALYQKVARSIKTGQNEERAIADAEDIIETISDDLQNEGRETYKKLKKKQKELERTNDPQFEEWQKELQALIKVRQAAMRGGLSETSGELGILEQRINDIQSRMKMTKKGVLMSDIDTETFILHNLRREFREVKVIQEILSRF